MARHLTAVRFKSSIRLPAASGGEETFWILVSEYCLYKLYLDLEEQVVYVEREGKYTVVPMSNVVFFQLENE